MKAFKPVVHLNTHPHTISQLLERALSFYEQGDLASSQAIFLEISAFSPSSLSRPDSHLNDQRGTAMAYLGKIAAQSNNLELACEWLFKALQTPPTQNDADIHFELGCFLELKAKSAEDLDLAVKYYGLACDLDINHHSSFFNKANIHKKRGEWQEALRAYNAAIFIDSSNPYYYNNRGDLLLELRSLPGAEKDFQNALELDPSVSYFYDNMGNILKEIDRLGAAKEFYKKSLAIDPQNALTYNNLGNLFLAQEVWDKALACYEMALRLEPKFYQALYNKGLLYQRFNLFQEALSCYERALKINPQSFEVKWNITIIELTQGDFEAGLLGYENRWGLPENRGLYPTTRAPQLRPGMQYKRLLVWAEHGLGNEIFWANFLRHPEFAEKKILAQFDPRLKDLLGAALSDKTSIEFIDNMSQVGTNEYDAHLPLSSLLSYLGLNPKKPSKAFYFDSPYLKPHDPCQSTQVLRELGVRAEKELLIGIAWKTTNLKTGTRRSIDLSRLLSIFSGLPVQCLSLQYGDVESEILSCIPTEGFENKGAKRQQGIKVLQYKAVDNYTDINGLSNLVHACDLVISIDSSVLHLASAMGKPTCALLSFVADWRWFIDTDLSPWYKNTKLYRQAKWGDWSSALRLLRSDLEKVVSTRWDH